MNLLICILNVRNSRGDNIIVKKKFLVLTTNKSLIKGSLKKFIVNREIKKIMERNNIEEIMQIGSRISDIELSIEFQQRLIELNNPKFLYLYAKYVKNANIVLLENALITLNNLEYIYLLAKDVKGSNIEKLSRAIAKSLDISYIIKFANNIENVDLDIFERMLIRESDVEKIIAFINGVPACDSLKMIKAIIVFGTDEQIDCFLKNNNLISIEQIKKYLMDEKDYVTMCKLANYVEHDDLEEHIIKLHNPKYLFEYAKCCHDIDVEKIQKEMINLHDIEYMYLLGLNVKGINHQQIVDAIIKEENGTLTNQLDVLLKCVSNYRDIDLKPIEEFFLQVIIVRYLYLLALASDKVNVNLIESKIIESKNVMYMCLFALNIKNANIILLEKNIYDNCHIEDIKILKSFYETMIERKILTVDNYEDTIIKLHTARYIYELIKMYDNVHFEKLEAAIIETNDLEYIYKVAKIKRNGELIKEEDALVNGSDLTYLILFYSLEKANRKRIEERILNCGIASCIYSFAIRYDTIDSSLIMQALLASGDNEYLFKYNSYLERNIKAKTYTKKAN